MPAVQIAGTTRASGASRLWSGGRLYLVLRAVAVRDGDVNMVRSGGGFGLTQGGDERRHGMSDICRHVEGQHQDSTDEEHHHGGL